MDGDAYFIRDKVNQEDSGEEVTKVGKDFRSDEELAKDIGNISVPII